MKKARAYLMIFGLLSIYCTSNEPKNDTKIIEPVKQEVDKLQEVSKTRIEETKKSASLEINIGNIKFKEISLYTSKESILETLGKPNKIIEPKYDCGPFSEAWQEMKFFQYSYEGMNFIVDETGDATIQDIDLTGDLSIEINGITFDKSLNFNNVINKLGIKPNKNYNKTMIFLIPKPYLDEEYLLIFEDGKLMKFDRTESC